MERRGTVERDSSELRGGGVLGMVSNNDNYEISMEEPQWETKASNASGVEEEFISSLSYQL